MGLQKASVDRWALGLLALALALRLYQINIPFLEPYNSITRQTLVAMVARNFYEHDFDFFYPEIDRNGSGPSLYNAELPIHSYLMAIGYKLAGGVKPWAARGVSVAFSMGMLVALFLLARRLYGIVSARIALAFAALSPMSVALGRSLQPESLMFFASVGAVSSYGLFMKTSRLRYYAASLLCTFIAVASKIYNFYLFIPLAYLAWRRDGRKSLTDPKNYIYLAMVSTALIWYGYGWSMGRHYALGHTPFNFFNRGPAGKSYAELLVSAPHLLFVSKVFVFHLMTPLGFLLFCAGFFKGDRTPADRLIRIWFLSVVLLMAVLWKAVIEHSYYQAPFLLVAGFYVARGALRIFQSGWFRGLVFKKVWVGLALALEAFALFYFYRGLYRIPEERRAILAAGEAIQRLTSPGTLVVASHETNESLVYYCHRKGWLFDMYSERDDALIKRLEDYRRQGADYFAISSLKDFQRAPRFEAYLKDRFTLVERGRGYEIFDLKNGQRGSSRSPS